MFIDLSTTLINYTKTSYPSSHATRKPKSDPKVRLLETKKERTVLEMRSCDSSWSLCILQQPLSLTDCGKLIMRIGCQLCLSHLRITCFWLTVMKLKSCEEAVQLIVKQCAQQELNCVKSNNYSWNDQYIGQGKNLLSMHFSISIFFLKKKNWLQFCISIYEVYVLLVFYIGFLS